MKYDFSIPIKWPDKLNLIYIVYYIGPKDCVVRVGRMVSSATKTNVDTAKICYNEEEVFYPKH